MAQPLLQHAPASGADLSVSAKLPREGSDAFAHLDDLAQQTDSHGVVWVQAGQDAFAGLARHIQRRCTMSGRQAVVCAGATVDDAWQQLARGLGIVAPDIPEDAAAAIADAARGAVIVVAEREGTLWGRAVRDELSRLCADPDKLTLLVVLSDSAAPITERALVLGKMSDTDGHRWWSAVVHTDSFAKQRQFSDLANIDRWWEAIRRQTSEQLEQRPNLSSDAALLLDNVVHARQALSAEQVATIGGDVDELVRAGLATVDEAGRVAATEDTLARPLNASGKRKLADLLAGGDGWARIRAAELRASVGDAVRAEKLAFEGLSSLRDAGAREDLWRRWDAALEQLKKAPDKTLARLVRSAEHALALGDSDRADRMARQAMALDGDRFAVLLLHGRSSHARGDATTAALSLTRAIGAAQSKGERGRACALMAQVRYMAGDPKQAGRYANEAIDFATDVVTRLDGRNVIGKLLLAKEAWQEAEQHFAGDAYDAARASEHQAELRARLNRAIAVLYLGRREQAREMLEEVMADGERHGVHRAVAYTLANLATIAILQHQYERALSLSERAIEVCRRYEPRAGLVQPVTNLAELRLRLGMVNEAEHTVRFGLQACGNGLPLSRYAYFAKVMAAIHLTRGETNRAAKECATAISGATCAGDIALLAQCHRIAARIALEDGDVARARAAIAAANEVRHSPFGQAELAVLETRLARALGDAYIEQGRKALTLAQQADDPETVRASHVLLFHAYRDEGDEPSAQSHLRAAINARERLASSLRPTLRQRFLGKKELVELDELELAEPQDAAAPITERSTSVAIESAQWSRAERRTGRPAAPSKTRRLVGDSPAMRSLRGTVKRVASTEATVLINGPTGAGKELVAEAIHRASDRARGPLVKVNCAALVETLLLSELFGHEKGAFTGASARRRGRFELAEGGTLFLDEIGDISARTQVALLRVLQDGIFERVGGCTQLHANVRIVCATHRDLKAMVERGEFRQDLYYRLCGVVLEVPSLKDRVADLPQLAAVLCVGPNGSDKRLSDEAARALARHGWPGNVRELENALRVASLFARGEEIELSDFTDNVEGLRYLAELPTVSRETIPPPPMSSATESIPPSNSTDLVYAEIRTGTTLSNMKRRLEQECIARALVESGGNITRAAKLLGMKRPRLSQLVKQYKLASVLEDIKS